MSVSTLMQGMTEMDEERALDTFRREIGALNSPSPFIAGEDHRAYAATPALALCAALLKALETQ